MNIRNFFSEQRCGPLLVLAVSGVWCATVPAQNAEDDKMRANPVFVGTIEKMEAVGVSGIQPSAKTALVKVDRVIKKPTAITLVKGDVVTVELKDPSVFRPGVQATFFTRGWIAGKGIAVREVAHELARTAAARAVPEREDTLKRLETAALKLRAEAADIVAAGRVVSVAKPAVARAERPFVTEHDPNWQDAVIQVQTGLKGVKSKEQLVVRFPASEDVAYFGMPKFKVGQEGVFFLKRDKLSGLPRAAVADRVLETCTVMEHADALPKREVGRVRKLLKR
ncbi:MAG: hypothetical protein HY735_14120 [Verrucomicrobia bacterium]|nr:hypothetical protein [Verrucomicrobiota bacterium]